MSLERKERITCRCGTPLEVVVSDSVNGMRYPHLKKSVLERTLHTFTCAACGTLNVVEKPVMYFDFDRKQFFCMYPRRDLAIADQRSHEVKRAYQTWLVDQAPPMVAAVGPLFLCRVCFGYEELREKIVIDDAGLSDIVVEALKLDVMRADPSFADDGVATLRLDGVLPDGNLALFPEMPDGSPVRRQVTVSRALYDEVDARFDEILGYYPGLGRGAHVSLLRLAAG